MDLLNDFLFGSVVTYPEIGERFVRIFLKTIFGREFKHLSVTAQKVFYGAGANRHGARLDMYREPDGAEDGMAAVYDIEPGKPLAGAGREKSHSPQAYHEKRTYTRQTGTYNGQGN